MSADALLLLGSNLGDRAATLRRAVAAIRRWDGARVTRVSRVFETAPVGPSDRPYLNQAVRLRTTRTPMGLLLEAKTLEAACGRRVAARWTSRPLDVDLVALGRARVRTPWLTVPHRSMAARAFALAPLADVAPERRLDGRRSVRALLAALRPDAAQVRPWRPRRTRLNDINERCSDSAKSARSPSSSTSTTTGRSARSSPSR